MRTAAMISYCIACYRPVYCRYLIQELIRKTTAPCEILLWVNVADERFELFLDDQIASGAPLRIVGRTPENIGMAAYPTLFSASRYDMVVQIDDDVVCVSPCIAERAKEIFDRFPQVGMLTADVWQDEFTTGARPTMQHYREVSREFGLYDGPIDGWFAIYRKTSLAPCSLHPGRYQALGCAIKGQLQDKGQSGLLFTRIKVFHVIGPAYASYFGMLESEIGKYSSLGRQEIVSWYTNERETIPSDEQLFQRVCHIRASLERAP